MCSTHKTHFDVEKERKERHRVQDILSLSYLKKKVLKTIIKNAIKQKWRK